MSCPAKGQTCHRHVRHTNRGVDGMPNLLHGAARCQDGPAGLSAAALLPSTPARVRLLPSPHAMAQLEE